MEERDGSDGNLSTCPDDCGERGEDKLVNCHGLAIDMNLVHHHMVWSNVHMLSLRMVAMGVSESYGSHGDSS
ncbi:hypothetical protein V6N12_044720 [Hibiscus sabdariffa]|uniref:Uncharacterized protein n=1 Tax=Hibiscus sabdariffa TaxID=183260 RepID=A0ABR2BAR7_9ROSI